MKIDSSWKPNKMFTVTAVFLWVLSGGLCILDTLQGRLVISLILLAAFLISSANLLKIIDAHSKEEDDVT